MGLVGWKKLVGYFSMRTVERGYRYCGCLPNTTQIVLPAMEMWNIHVVLDNHDLVR